MTTSVMIGNPKAAHSPTPWKIKVTEQSKDENGEWVNSPFVKPVLLAPGETATGKYVHSGLRFIVEEVISP